MFDKQPTSNEEILSQIDSIFDKLNNSGAHACYCKRSEDGGCECALKDGYMREVKQVFAAHLQAAVLKEQYRIAKAIFDEEQKANAVLQSGDPIKQGYTHLSGRIVGLQRARDIAQQLKKGTVR